MSLAVFVHGVPETAAMWDGVRSKLDRTSIALSLPGFGCARPDGFSATKDAYTEWLVGELDAIGEPVDLVGHDWGGILTVRVATAFGDRVRTWASDATHIFDEDYIWHDFAQTWQTPGDGEAFMAATRVAPPEDTAPLFVAMGVPEADALAMVRAGDEVMDQAILDLYRSAVPNAHHDWGGAIGPTAAPGLVLVATDDAFGNEAKSTEMASRLRAQVEVLDGLGHWWALQDPGRGAVALERFWAAHDG